MTELIIIETNNSHRIKEFLEQEKAKYKVYPQTQSAKKEKDEEEKQLAAAYEAWANDPEE